MTSVIEKKGKFGTPGHGHAAKHAARGKKGKSIKYPALYDHLRAKGYSKMKAAMISNGVWRKRHGKPRKSAKGVAASITSKGMPDGGSLSVPGILEIDKPKRCKKCGRKLADGSCGKCSIKKEFTLTVDKARDGDGDGFIYDGTPKMRPVMPAMLDMDDLVPLDDFTAAETKAWLSADPESDVVLELGAKKRKKEQEWKRRVARAISTGQMSPEESRSKFGNEGDKIAAGMGGGWYDSWTKKGGWQPLPEHTWHTTSNLSAVLDGGLKPRSEIEGPGGIGGGPTDTISLTSALHIAEAIRDDLLQAHSILNGETTFDDLKAEGKRDGWWDNWMNSISKLQLESRDLTNPEDVYRLWAKDGMMWNRQSVEGGRPNSLFMGESMEALKNLDPENIGILKVTAVDGAQGVVPGGMEEWRIPTGEAVTVEDSRLRPDPIGKARDGDGDGFVNDGKPNMRPARPSEMKRGPRYTPKKNPRGKKNRKATKRSESKNQRPRKPGQFQDEYRPNQIIGGKKINQDEANFLNFIGKHKKEHPETVGGLMNLQISLRRVDANPSPEQRIKLAQWLIENNIVPRKRKIPKAGFREEKLGLGATPKKTDLDDGLFLVTDIRRGLRAIKYKKPIPEIEKIDRSTLDRVQLLIEGVKNG